MGIGATIVSDQIAPNQQKRSGLMEKRNVIGIPPNPNKRGGPFSGPEKFKRDGEQPRDTFIPTILPENSPRRKKRKKRKKARNQATGKITVTVLPAGEAPEHVRRAWIGLTLPCYPISGYAGGDTGVLSGVQLEKNRSGFYVPQTAAIRILEKSRPMAAQWWRENGYPKRGENFQFGEREAKIVSGVRGQQIIEVRDGEHGDPYR